METSRPTSQLFPAAASPQSSESQSSSDCGSSSSSYSSSMSTPIKPRTVNLSDHGIDPMKAALKLDLTGHNFKEISVVDFATTVWGLDKDVAQKIGNAKFTLPEQPANLYEKVLTTRNYSERHLHAPFLEIHANLLKQVCDLLDISLAEFDNTFWDGKGDAMIRNQYTKRKPDLLNINRLVVGIVWELVNAVVEFKRHGSDKDEETKETPLPTIPEDTKLNVLNPSATSEPRGNNKRSGNPGNSTQWKPAGSHQASASIQSDFLSSVGTNSTIYSATTISSGKRSADEALGSDTPSGRTSARKRARVTRTTLDQLQLATYALECLGASSRHYVTGIFIDKYRVSLWCYNRTTVFRSAIFKWNEDLQSLALALFALTQCDMKHAGFDPNVHRFVPPQPDDPVSASAILPLEQPAEKMENLCFRFSSGAAGVPDWVFWIHKVLYTYRGIVGRGTFVATVRAAIVGEVMRKPLFAFKQSWQYQVRAHEAIMISKLRESLPEYWRQRLPKVIFYTKFDAESLGLPHTLLKQQIPGLLTKEAQERDLHILVSTFCHNLWEVKDIEEFKRVFLDCLECHYHAYHTGHILHRDISENNLMVFRVEPSADAMGILNDFDMAVERLPEAKEAQVSAAHHRTGTLPFMALELLDNHETEPVHLYRHDLESFFYILIWAATHYDFESQTRRSTPNLMNDWLNPKTAPDMKFRLLNGPYFQSAITPLRLKPFDELWQKWVVPLRVVFGRAFHERTYGSSEANFDNITINGQVTFEKFMAAIGETPRGLNPKSKGAIGVAK